MTDRHGKLGAAVLAGGKASRYAGADKAALDCGDGRSIVRRLLDELALAGFEEAVLCANDPGRYASLPVPVIGDLRPGAGPLGGIEAALAHFGGRTEGVALLPCDLPGISAREIRVLAEAFRAGGARVVVAQTGDSFWHPLCAVVHNDVLVELTAALDAGRRGVGRLWRSLGAAAVRFQDEEPFFNVNTPEDMAGWRERHGRCR